MNSKKALEHICKTCDNKSCPYIHYEKSRCAFYGVIKQDLDKLEQYKQLEKELGISLELYVNSHLKGVYVKGMDPSWSGGQINEIVHYTVVNFTKDYLEVRYANGHKTHLLYNPLGSYGKTWAFKKEDLENE